MKNLFQKLPNKKAIYEHSWIKEFDKSLHCYSCHINSFDTMVNGIGISFIEECAVNSALGECFERMSLYKNKLESSSGCAFHKVKEKAERGSKLEYEERANIISCLKLRSGVEKIDNSLIKCPDTKRLISNLSRRSINSIFYRCSTQNSSTIVYICDLRMLDKGLILGSCNSLIKGCFIHSMLEVLYDLFKLLSGTETESISIDEFLSLDEVTFEDHFRLGLDKPYANKIIDIFNESLNRENDFMLSYKTSSASVDDSIEGKGYFFRSYSNDFYDLVPGRMILENVPVPIS